MLRFRLGKYEVKLNLFRMKSVLALTKETKKQKGLEEMHIKYKDFINVVLKVAQNHMAHKEA